MKQRDVAQLLGCDETSVRNWELGKTEPMNKYMPAIIEFLGYDSLPKPTTLPEKLIRYRQVRGLSQRQLADELGVCQESISGWEQGMHVPSGSSIRLLSAILDGDG